MHLFTNERETIMRERNTVPAVNSLSDRLHSWIPPWIDGETLYSLCSRYHRIAGDRRASETCQRLFGHPRAGLSHDVPGRIGGLLVRSQGILGTPDEVVLGRTVLGYYLSFRPRAEQRKVIDELLVDSPRGLKARLGWLATRMGAAHPLRACGQCVADDLKSHHTPTWRLVHQLPAVWVCPHHGSFLWTTGWKSNGTQRFQWVLPDAIPDQARHVPAFDWSDDALAQAALVAKASASIAAWWSREPFSMVDMANTLRNALINRGFATSNGRLKTMIISHDLTAFMSKFAEWPEAPALCLGSGAALTALRRVIRADGRPSHPLRYIVAAAWLFGSWESFATACRGQCELPPTPTDHPSQAKDRRLTSSVRNVFLEKLDAGAGAVTTLARVLGIDAGTGLVWAEQAGRVVHRRPKILDERTRADIARELALGHSKTIIAERHHVSVVTITRILLSIPGLKDRRDQRLHDRRDSRARLEICRCVSRHPNIGTKELRERCQASFAWLYRHDRPWLRSQTQGLRRIKHRQPSRVNWNVRDREFAHAIASLQQGRSATLGAPGLFRPGDLVRAIPGLRQKVRHLSRMPLTANAIVAATGTEPRRG